MKDETDVVLKNTLGVQRYMVVAEETARRSHLRITVDVNNYLDEPVTCVKANRVIHEIEPGVENRIGRALVVKVTVRARGALVKINADVDYSEEFMTGLFNRYKDQSDYRITREWRQREGVHEYTGWFVFDARKLNEVNNRVTVPEIGMDILVGRCKDDIRGTYKERYKRLSPTLVPVNDKRPSGFVINGVDPNHVFDKMFYRFGKEVFEVDIDRSTEEEPGLYIGFWNRINDRDEPIIQTIEHIPMDEVISGKHPSGISVYPSIIEAILGRPEPLKDRDKEPKVEKENKWEKKDQQAKVSHTWVKITIDLLKHVLPAAITIAKGLFTLLGKSKGLPI